MDIRTKLALSLVFVSLLSMGLLGAFAYLTSEKLLHEGSLQQLNVVLQSKSKSIINAEFSWKNQVHVLRQSADLNNWVLEARTGDETSIKNIQIFVHGLLNSLSSISHIRLIGIDAKKWDFGSQTAALNLWAPMKKLIQNNNARSDEGVSYVGTYIGKDSGLYIVYSGLIGDENIGSSEGNPTTTNPMQDKAELQHNVAQRVIVVFNTEALLDATTDYMSLGKHGDVVLIESISNTKFKYLNVGRFKDSNLRLKVIGIGNASESIQNLLAKKSKPVDVVQVERDGVKSWVAAQYIPSLKWGLVVTKDASAEAQRATTLRDAIFDIALALSAFAIIGGTLLGFYLAKPIHELAVLVGRFRRGETTLRADAQGDDEIAYLAESLNELMDHIDLPSSSADGKSNVDGTPSNV